MLKAHAWNSQVSLADVDPGDHLGVKRKKIAAASEKYGPELLDLQERLFAEKKTGDPDCSAGFGYQRQRRNGPPRDDGDEPSRGTRPSFHGTKCDRT